MNIPFLFKFLHRRQQASQPAPSVTDHDFAINLAFYKMEGFITANAEITAAHRKVIELNKAILAKLPPLLDKPGHGFQLAVPVDISLKILLDSETLTCCRQHEDGSTDFWLTETDLRTLFAPVTNSLAFHGLHLARVTLREKINAPHDHLLVCEVTPRVAA